MQSLESTNTKLAVGMAVGAIALGYVYSSSQPAGFSLDDIPDQTNKTIIITGGNSGLGQQTALELARKGATVIVTCRSAKKGEAAVKRIQEACGPSAKISYGVCDLGDFQSIQSFCQSVRRDHAKVDTFIANAGVVRQPTHTLTKDGHEIQMQANFFSHFLMIESLLGLLEKSDDPCIVFAGTAQGILAKTKIDMEDIDWKKRIYSLGESYECSRLAQMLYLHHLNTQGVSKGKAVAFAPGLVQRPPENAAHDRTPAITKLFRVPVEVGVLHPLQAATDPKMPRNTMLEPKWFVRGPGVPKPLVKSVTAQSAQELYTFSRDLLKRYL